jgi:hypothetical protein
MINGRWHTSSQFKGNYVINVGRSGSNNDLSDYDYKGCDKTGENWAEKMLCARKQHDSEAPHLQPVFPEVRGTQRNYALQVRIFL